MRPLGTSRLGSLAFAGMVALAVAWPAPRVLAQDVDVAHALPPRPLPVVGKPYGELVLPTLDGSRSVDLDVYRGRKVLLIEFASW